MFSGGYAAGLISKCNELEMQFTQLNTSQVRNVRLIQDGTLRCGFWDPA
tara:strand:+ start:708 stop:854 length:147 start_codon:yes stop_codon:yes gene_type:complete